MPKCIHSWTKGWINLWIQWCRKSKALTPHPCPLLSFPLALSWASGSSQESNRPWSGPFPPIHPPHSSSEITPQFLPTAVLPRLSGFRQLKRKAAECLCSVYHSLFGIFSAAGALSIRPLSIYKLSNVLVDCKAGNVYTCHSHSWPKCFLLTVAPTVGRWHHLLLIVSCATDMSGFGRMCNLVIRLHLQSNHESHYGEKASKSWRSGCLVFDFPYPAEDCKRCCRAKQLYIYF